MNKGKLITDLMKREDELMNLMEKLHKERGIGPSSYTMPLDIKDSVGTACDLTEKEFLSTEMLNVSNELSLVRHALYKIRNHPDRFGICELCLKNIDTQRLEAKPWARYCRTCKENKEKHAKNTRK